MIQLKVCIHSLNFFQITIIGNFLVVQCLCNVLSCVQLFATLWTVVHQASLWIFPARILEWVAISLSRGSFLPRDETGVSCIAGRFFTTEPRGKPSPVVRTWHFHCRSWHEISYWRTKILQAVLSGQQKSLYYNFFRCTIALFLSSLERCIFYILFLNRKCRLFVIYE